MTSWREEVIGGARLICADCRDVLPTLDKVDLTLTDPPYGINYAGLLKGKGDGYGNADKNGWKDYGAPEWDQSRPPADMFNLILESGKTQIIWGGNYFADLLPPTMRWLVWDKGQRNFSLADVELAWTSDNKAARAFTYPRALALQDGKQHPTQKPEALMKWCIGLYPQAETVLDCYLGSGTSGVAAVQMGKRFIGIEREERYFEIACRRIEQAQRQGDLFIEGTAA